MVVTCAALIERRHARVAQIVMKIQAEKLALATSVVVAILFAACWAIVRAMPDAAMALTEDMFHMQMDEVAWKLTPGSLLLGTAAWAVSSGVTVWLIGKLYNRLCHDTAD